MLCGGCGNKHAYRIKLTSSGECCDVCGNLRVKDTAQPDVFLGGKGGVQTSPNLCDFKTGKPIPFSSKKEKKIIMDRLHLRQADSAEKQHGYRNEKYLHRKIYG